MTIDKREEQLRISSCVGKHRHESALAAKKQLERGKRRKNPGTNHVKLNVYRCRFCQGYHIGNNLKG